MNVRMANDLLYSVINLKGNHFESFFSSASKNDFFVFCTYTKLKHSQYMIQLWNEMTTIYSTGLPQLL